MTVHIRLASPQDLSAINDIYNHYVLHSTCTYRTEPQTEAEVLAWFNAHDEKHPITVAHQDGGVVGWASISPFNSRCAYQHTVENSVYVDHRAHRRGIGQALMDDLMARARRIGHHTVIAGVDADQSGSVQLHERMGFHVVAHLRQVGFKFNRWLDIVYMQAMLDDVVTREAV